MSASVMQLIFGRGRATSHDAQIRHTMDPPSKQDGRGALHRRSHDLDCRDHDRHHGWRAPRNEEYRTCQNTRRFPTAHLDPAAPEAGHAILCRVRVGTRRCWTCASGPRCVSWVLQRWKKHEHYNESLAPQAPRLAARAAREHLNGTLFDESEMEKEEPPKETDLIFHDDDDDDAEDPESRGTPVAEAVVPIVFTPMQDRRCACTVPLMRCCARVRPLSSRHDLGGSSNSQMRALKTEVEFPSIRRLSHSTISACSRRVCVCVIFSSVLFHI